MKDLGRYVMYGQPVIADPTKQFILNVDLGGDDDHSAATLWKGGSIEYTITLKDCRWYDDTIRDFLRKKKALRYAVTHGYTITILCLADGKEYFFDITLPRMLNAIFRKVPFIPRLKITKDGRCYVIRKGKIRPHRIWPVSQRMIDYYENKILKQ